MRNPFRNLREQLYQRLVHAVRDLYASAGAIFDLLKPRIGPGVVIV